MYHHNYQCLCINYLFVLCVSPSVCVSCRRLGYDSVDVGGEYVLGGSQLLPRIQKGVLRKTPLTVVCCEIHMVMWVFAIMSEAEECV